MKTSTGLKVVEIMYFATPVKSIMVTVLASEVPFIIRIISFPYAGSVLFNRGYFDSKALLKSFDFQKHDIDFIFNHQPELTYNVYNALLTGRIGMSVDAFNFFHWVDCEKSKPVSGYPAGFFRQLEAIDLSYKSYFHSPASMEYLKSNWSKVPHTSLGVDDNVMKEKINFFPLGVGNPTEPEPFSLDQGIDSAEA